MRRLRRINAERTTAPRQVFPFFPAKPPRGIFMLRFAGQNGRRIFFRRRPRLPDGFCFKPCCFLKAFYGVPLSAPRFCFATGALPPTFRGSEKRFTWYFFTWFFMPYKKIFYFLFFFRLPVFLLRRALSRNSRPKKSGGAQTSASAALRQARNARKKELGS